MILVATLAAFGGFCFAGASAFASLRYNIWKASPESFQLGYVIGYIDAVRLGQRKDPRASIPTGNDKNFDRWVRDVNAFYANPNNENRAVPDAMYEIGNVIRTQMLKEWGLKRQGRPVPSSSPTP